MVAIHAGEVVWLERSRLRRSSVRMGGRVWWAWVCSIFVEGFPATVRFDRLVREEEVKKARQKH